MVKTDLREFIASKRNAVAGAIGLNPGQQATGERVEYKWPTKTLGSQVHVSHSTSSLAVSGWCVLTDR